MEHAIAPDDKTRDDCIWNLLTNEKSSWGLTQSYSRNKAPQKKIHRTYVVQCKQGVFKFRNIETVRQWLGCAEKRLYGMAPEEMRELRVRGRKYLITFHKKTTQNHEMILENIAHDNINDIRAGELWDMAFSTRGGYQKMELEHWFKLVTSKDNSILEYKRMCPSMCRAENKTLHESGSVLRWELSKDEGDILI